MNLSPQLKQQNHSKLLCDHIPMHTQKAKKTLKNNLNSKTKKKNSHILHRRRGTAVDDVVAEALAAAGGLLGLQEPGLALLQAQP